MTELPSAPRAAHTAPTGGGRERPGPPVAFNPLPWYATDTGFDFENGPPVDRIYREIREAGFTAVHAEVPATMTSADYRMLLNDVGLIPAPGYFQAPLSDASAVATSVESARRTAARHAELGLTRIFIADQFGAPPRLIAPATGAGHDPARLHRLIETLATVAVAMTEEGVTPCLHQHVGTWIETPAETTTVLDAIDPTLLLFGPDTGHLAWAGADPIEMITRYRNRVGAVHLKDLRASTLHPETGGSEYQDLVRQHLWTEPGRGNVDLDGVLDALAGYDGWYVIEVDVADQSTPALSAAVSAEWAGRRLGVTTPQKPPR